MADPSFIHLHVHSEYSIYDSVVSIDALLEACVRERYPAVALTDLCNTYALVRFYKKALEKGVKPIIGSEIWIEREGGLAKILLFCLNDIGFLNLKKLISDGYLHAKRDPIPILNFEILQKHAEGLIALIIEDPCIQRPVINQDYDSVVSQVQLWKQMFPNALYFGVSRLHDQDASSSFIKAAELNTIPLVAINSVCFVQRQDYEAHEARVCIQEGSTLAQTRVKRYHEEQYFKSSVQMEKLFHDLPSALINSVEIAKRCNVRLTLGQSFLPEFPVPNGFTAATFLEQSAEKGLRFRFDKRILKALDESIHQETEKHYMERLKTELRVINAMGFAGYFLIVADFIQWAKRNDIPVGPGRGSGAGSLVAYALEITDLDPIPYDLLFERFLNPDRVSMPDFDIDFCMERRDDVIQYVADRYGRHAVAQIATFGTMAAKAVIRDVGRVLSQPYGFVDKISKLIPFEIGMTLEKALVDEPALLKRYQEEEEVKVLINLAKKLEGLTRNVGKHAGGVVIAPKDIIDFSPLYCEDGTSHIVTQLDKDDIESIGLVKFDFLGLRTLTIIQWAVQFVNQLKPTHEKLCIDDIPLDDSKTFELLKACSTTAVFQLESRGMKDLIHRLGPDHFEEIIALVALFRPGPLQSGMVDDFINRKHGRSVVEYLHPDLEPILKPTYGVILYQEQVMQIAQTLAGYTLGEADLLRRAMGKKKPEEMAQQRAFFVKGALERTIDESIATTIFDLMEKFAGYGFNKSHSAAYALVSYQTAWLKTHYPQAFMSAVLSSDMGHTEKLVTFVNETKKMGLVLKQPNVNESCFAFYPAPTGEIIYGLGAIKGVGEGAIESIVESRSAGPYRDLFDFCQRIDLRKVNRRVFDALIKSGAFDCFGFERAQLSVNVDKALRIAEKRVRDQSFGQSDMFSESAPPEEMIEVKPWPEMIRLKGEKDTLGFYLSGHPLEALKGELGHFVSHFIANLPHRETKVVIAGLLASHRSLITKKGDRMAIINLEDHTGTIDAAVFSDLYQKCRECLVKDALIVVIGTVQIDPQTQNLRLRADDVMDLAHARTHYANHLKITLNQESFDVDKLVRPLQNLLNDRKGSCSVLLEYVGAQYKAELMLGQSWQVLPTEDFLNQLKDTLGELAVNLEYDTED